MKDKLLTVVAALIGIITIAVALYIVNFSMVSEFFES